MDAHPIPQNVTSFQFKLVGDMTLKQFLYLAAGLGFAYLLFVTATVRYPLIAWPVMIIAAVLGVAFAFMPIASRPLDHWVVAYLRAIYSPTKRAWKKNNKTFKEDSLFPSRLIMYLAGSPLSQVSAAPVSQQPETDMLRQMEPLPTQEELGKTVDLARQAQQLQMKIIQTERTLSQIKTEAQKPTPVPIDYSQQVNTILADLSNLVNQASTIKAQIQKVAEPTETDIPAPAVREKVKVIVPPKPKRTTVALTSFPNVVNGIVKDATGNYLEGTVAVIYDKEGLPVRALKSNKLGQFTGSTPLPNGTYTLELEKDGFTFDVLQIELSGEILPPLSITAK